MLMDAQHHEDLVIGQDQLLPELLGIIMLGVHRVEVDRGDRLAFARDIQMIVDRDDGRKAGIFPEQSLGSRSEEHTSELQSLMCISYAVFCLKIKKNKMLLTHLTLSTSF